jgi:bacterioferritin-associated ferredoxin
MYICVCNAITERHIDDAVAEGCCTLRELRQQLGVGVGCGRCARCARDVLKDTLQMRIPASPAAAQLTAA